MLGFIAKKTVGAALVMFGVLLLTFVLFRVAAGDPARAVLGKNPSPKEVEDLRMTLSSGKPLLYGWWRATELYSSADFSEEHLPKGVEILGPHAFENRTLRLDGGSKLLFKRNFDTPSDRIRTEITLKGAGTWADKTFDTENRWRKLEGLFDGTNAAPDVLILSVPENGTARIRSASFSRCQASPWDSQFAASLREIATFSSTAPYVSFFNFGRSLTTKEPVAAVIARGVGPSLSLMIPIVVGELLGGILVAMIATACRGRWPDHLIMFLSIVGMSVSYVVILIAGQWFFAYWLGWFPIWGFESPFYLALPVALGIISGLGGGARFYRTIFVNELGREYLRTAEAKGCPRSSVYFRHLLRNTAVPIINRLSVIAPFLFTGSLLLESFFGIPGLGYAGFNALKNSDLQTIKALVVATAAIFIVVNLMSDLICAWADPRYRTR